MTIENINVTPEVNKTIYDILNKCAEEFGSEENGGSLFLTFARGLKKHNITPVATDIGPMYEEWDMPRKYRQNMPDFDSQINYAEVFNDCESVFWKEYHEDKDMEFYDSADSYKHAAFTMMNKYNKAIGRY